MSIMGEQCAFPVCLSDGFIAADDEHQHVKCCLFGQHTESIQVGSGTRHTVTCISSLQCLPYTTQQAEGPLAFDWESP